MASFVKRSSGNWAYVVSGSRDPSTGRYAQRWRSGCRTKKEEVYEREMADRRSGRHVPPSQLTVGEYLESRWLPAVEASVRSSTFAYHRYRVERTIVPALGRIALQELGSDDLERFYAQMLKGGRIRGEGGPVGERRQDSSPTSIR